MFSQFAKRLFSQKQIQILGISSAVVLGHQYYAYNQYQCQQVSNSTYKSKKYFDEKLDWHFRKMSQQNFSNVILLGGKKSEKLAQDVAEFLGIPLTPMSVSRFPDDEVNIQLDVESVRGKHIYIVQSTVSPINESLVELALLSGWLKRNSAKKITVIMPYYGYCRDKKGRRSGPDAARILDTMPIDTFLTLDIHAGQTLGYYSPRTRFENLEATIVPLNYFLNIYDEKREDFVIISPDAEGVNRAKNFCEKFNVKGGANCNLGIILRHEHHKSEQNYEIVGEVEGKNVIIIDDLIDTANTLKNTVQALKQNGAKKVYAYATHTLFTGKAFQNIKDSGVDKIITTDTIPPQEDESQCTEKILRLTIAPLLGEAMRRLHHNLSLENLTGGSYQAHHKKSYYQQMD